LPSASRITRRLGGVDRGKNSALGSIAMATSREQSAGIACSPTSRFIGLPGDRLFVLALLCPPARFGDLPAGDTIKVPTGYAQFRAKSSNRRARPHARVHRHSPLEHHAQGRAFRASNSRSCLPAKCAPSSGNCDDAASQKRDAGGLSQRSRD